MAEKWASDPEWRAEKTKKEKERRKKPEVLAVDRPRNAERARRNRETRPGLRDVERARCREYYHNVRKVSPKYRDDKAAYERTRRARKSGSSGRNSRQDIASILKRQNYKCAECGTSVRNRSNRHVDHIMPLALGGSNDPVNLQILCPPCNLSKGAAHPIDFARRKGRLL